MTPARTWTLHSAMHAVSWGGFASEDHAWRFLFGQEVGQAERDESRSAGWVVDQCSEHPSMRREAA
jgi:hypothetical protein